MSSIESDLDALYQKPLDEFTSARNALAKTLSGDAAARVRKLPKPTVVPWAVNQLYWHARPVFDRLRASGERLRTAQLSALKGKSADVRGAGDAQRKAVADAVQHVTALTAKAGSHPNADELTRTLEALSLAAELSEPPGRLTRPLQPAGFEALAGVPIRALPGPAKAESPAKAGHAAPKEESVRLVRHPGGETARRAEREARERHAREQADQRRAQAELHRAEAAVDRARAAEAQARAALARATEQVQAAERAVSDARRAVKS